MWAPVPPIWLVERQYRLMDGGLVSRINLGMGKVSTFPLVTGPSSASTIGPGGGLPMGSLTPSTGLVAGHQVIICWHQHH